MILNVIMPLGLPRPTGPGPYLSLTPQGIPMSSTAVPALGELALAARNRAARP